MGLGRHVVPSARDLDRVIVEILIGLIFPVFARHFDQLEFGFALFVTSSRTLDDQPCIAVRPQRGRLAGGREGVHHQFVARLHHRLHIRLAGGLVDRLVVGGRVDLFRTRLDDRLFQLRVRLLGGSAGCGVLQLLQRFARVNTWPGNGSSASVQLDPAGLVDLYVDVARLVEHLDDVRLLLGGNDLLSLRIGFRDGLRYERLVLAALLALFLHPLYALFVFGHLLVVIGLRPEIGIDEIAADAPARGADAAADMVDQALLDARAEIAAVDDIKRAAGHCRGAQTDQFLRDATLQAIGAEADEVADGGDGAGGQ